MKALSSHQVIEFLSLLLQEVSRGSEVRGLEVSLSLTPSLSLQEPLPLTHVQKMQQVYDLNACMNAEIRFR